MWCESTFYLFSHSRPPPAIQQSASLRRRNISSSFLGLPCCATPPISLRRHNRSSGLNSLPEDVLKMRRLFPHLHPPCEAAIPLQVGHKIRPREPPHLKRSVLHRSVAVTLMRAPALQCITITPSLSSSSLRDTVARRCDPLVFAPCIFGEK